MNKDESDKVASSMPSLLVLLPAHFKDGTERFAIIVARALMAHRWRICVGIRRSRETESIVREFREMGAFVRTVDVCETGDVSRRVSFRKRITRVMRLLWRERPDVMMLAVPDVRHGLGPRIAAAIMGIPLISVSSLFRQKTDAHALTRIRHRLFHCRRQRHVILASIFDESFGGNGLPDNSHTACLQRQDYLVSVPVRSARDSNQENLLRSHLKCEQRDRIALTLGTISSKNDFDQFAAAIPHVVAAYPNTKFVWVGDEHCQASLRALIDRYCIGHCVYLFAPCNQPQFPLSDADLFVHPMRYSGFPHAVLEAVVAGLPVVAVRAGLVPEVLSHQETGLLYDDDDVHDLREKIIYALENPDAMRAMAAQAYQRVIYWDTAAAARDTVSYLRKLVQKR